MTGRIGERSPHESLSEAIRAEARRLGFARVGILPAGPSRTHAFYAAWLARGYDGEMAYLQRHAAPKADPRRWAEGVRSVICLAARYPANDESPPSGAPRGRISRYARARDYHDVLGERLRALAAFIEARAGRPVRHRIAVDSAPLMEREWAARAGLGWVGRNAMLIDWELGSYLFLAELPVDLDLDYDTPETLAGAASPQANPVDDSALPRIELGLRESCGTCRACLDACPTAAIVADKTVDSRRCISYLTIELKGPIPREHRVALGGWVFGCDICQEVCPWNRHAEARVPLEGEHTIAELAAPDADAAHPRLVDLLALDEAGFRARFRHTALWRTRRRGLLRNAAIALGNRLAKRAAGATLSAKAREEALAALARTLADAEPVIRGAAAWALGRAGGPKAAEALRHALTAERDPAVREEIAAALAEPASAPASRNVGAPDAR